jgi:hypothetical protein
MTYYTDIKNPRWNDAEHITIECEVNFNHLPEEYVPFTAHPDDVMPYSKQIFDECVAGQWGEVVEYVPPPKEFIELKVRYYRDQLLNNMDKIVSNPLRWNTFTAEQQQAWATYRQALLDVPQQEGFPYTVNFPTTPVTE